MPKIITSHEKLAVIDDWLLGESRHDIAKKHNIANGTVYNIVQEWSNGIGIQIADRLREIAIKLKQNGLTISDCAIGLRLLMLLKKYEIEDDENEEKVNYFLKELYTKSQKVGLMPQQVFDYIGDILKFSSEIFVLADLLNEFMFSSISFIILSFSILFSKFLCIYFVSISFKKDISSLNEILFSFL